MEKSSPGGLETLMAGGGAENRCILSLFRFNKPSLPYGLRNRE